MKYIKYKYIEVIMTIYYLLNKISLITYYENI